MVDDKRLKYLENIYQDKCCITQNDKDIQSIIKELIEYRAIGTVEELKSLNHFVYDENLFEYKELYDKYKYCPNCGQKLDWSESDETRGNN